MVRRRNLEKAGATKIQALYRGHLGRLAAMKWAVKKAEIDAMRALQHAAARVVVRVLVLPVAWVPAASAARDPALSRARRRTGRWQPSWEKTWFLQERGAGYQPPGGVAYTVP